MLAIDFACKGHMESTSSPLSCALERWPRPMHAAPQRILPACLYRNPTRGMRIFWAAICIQLGGPRSPGPTTPSTHVLDSLTRAAALVEALLALVLANLDLRLLPAAPGVILVDALLVRLLALWCLGTLIDRNGVSWRPSHGASASPSRSRPSTPAQFVHPYSPRPRDPWLPVPLPLRLGCCALWIDACVRSVASDYHHACPRPLPSPPLGLRVIPIPRPCAGPLASLHPRRGTGNRGPSRVPAHAHSRRSPWGLGAKGRCHPV